MPFINVKLIAGYDDEDRIRLSQRLTDATVSVIKAPADLVTVVINEVAPNNYMRGRVGRTPGPAVPTAANIIRSYLSAMEQRDLDSAALYLADDFSMTFPGGVNFKTLGDMIGWAQQRYQSIGKNYERFDECYGIDDSGNGETVVYCYGTLHGEWLDGTKFNDIRFIDRFLIKDSLIEDQLVWNDLAEVSASN